MLDNRLTDWTLKEKLGQMVVVRASGYLSDNQIRYPAWEAPNAQLRQWLETLNIGGVILLGGSAAEIALRTQQLQSWADFPLLIAADIEEGVGQRFAGATWFPPPMALAEIAQKNLPLAQQLARQMGAVTAREALAIGINWILAPVADVNNNPENPVINVRAFGDTPEIVGCLAAAFIEGVKDYPALTAAKHFPGHGDTASDSHLNLPAILHPASRLAEVELPPFRQAIAAGVDSVMTAHLLIPAWDGERPATLSQPILTGQLRQNLGFEGLIVTDALIMGGVANFASPEEVAVMAVEAGADILLMPSNPESAIVALYEAVKSGRITEERIFESARRIWRAKQKLKPKLAEFPQQFLSQLCQPTAIETVNSILRESLQWGGKLPLQPASQGRNLIVVDDMLNCDFLDRQSPAVLLPKQLGYNLQLLDSNTLNLVGDDGRLTLLQVFIRGNPFRGTAGLTERGREIYEKLLQSPFLQGVVIYGSPYVLDWFRERISGEFPWVFSYGQMAESQEFALQSLFALSPITESVGGAFV